jgi:hypothetical protein
MSWIRKRCTGPGAAGSVCCNGDAAGSCSRPVSFGVKRLHVRTFTCPDCRRDWPENYCPECARTIDRSLDQPKAEPRSPRRETRLEKPQTPLPELPRRAAPVFGPASLLVLGFACGAYYMLAKLIPTIHSEAVLSYAFIIWLLLVAGMVCGLGLAVLGLVRRERYWVLPYIGLIANGGPLAYFLC